MPPLFSAQRLMVSLGVLGLAPHTHKALHAAQDIGGSFGGEVLGFGCSKL